MRNSSYSSYKGQNHPNPIEEIKYLNLICIWYENKEYDKIVDYIKEETVAFLQLNEWLYREMPLFLERFKKENNITSKNLSEDQ